jgi:glycosyltransferase involved in cell wall biosynthesis
MNRRIRVLHLITGLGLGGAETSLRNLALRMDRERFDVRVVGLIGGPNAEELAAAGTDVTVLGMRRGVPDPRSALKLRRILREFRPDILQTWLYHADLLGTVVRATARVPVLLWNVRCASMDMRLYRRLSGISVKMLARLSRIPQAVVVNSKAGLVAHEAIGYRPRKWELIPNGFDTTVYRPRPEARERLRSLAGVPGDALVVGLVGRYDPMKDHAGFLRAASRVSDPRVHFVLAGTGVTADNTELASEIAAAGLGKRVHLLGERRDLPDLTPGFDLACSSSAFGEGFPNVVGEAMSSGVPCVVTDVGDSAWVAGATGIVVPPRDPEALGSAISRLAASDAERARRGEEARRRIVEEFSIERVVRRYEELYSGSV